MPTAKPMPGRTLLTPTDHTLIMIDFQSQMAFATKSIDPVMLRNNAALVANAARIFQCLRHSDHGCGEDVLGPDV